MKYHIDSRKLIDAVSRRPPLYDKGHKMYSCNNKYKQRLWWESCREVYPKWGAIHPQNRIQLGRELQMRWKNLRTCFTREVALQKKESQERKEGKEVKPRKRYEHFQRMLFLLGNDQLNEMQVTLQNDEVEVTEDPLDSVKMEFTDDDLENDETPQITIEPEQIQRPDQTASNDIVAAKNDDDDKYFLLSLVNTFRQFDDKQKFEAKIEILQVLKRIRFAEQ